MTPYQDIVKSLWDEIARLQETVRSVHPLMQAAPMFFDEAAQELHGDHYRDAAARLHAAFQHANTVVVSTSQRLELLADDGPAGGRVQ